MTNSSYKQKSNSTSRQTKPQRKNPKKQIRQPKPLNHSLTMNFK